MIYRLTTMGNLRLLDASGRETAFSHNGLLILAYLYVDPFGEASRAKLAGLLWQDHPLSSGLTNLRKTIARIAARQGEMGSELLAFAKNSVTLNRALIDCDIAAMGDCLQDAPDLQSLRQMVSAFRGPFLETTDLLGGDLTRWRDIQRRRAIDRLSASIRACLPLVHTTHDLELIRDASSCLFQHDPSNLIIQHLRRSPDAVTSLTTFRSLFALSQVDTTRVGKPALRAASQVFAASRAASAMDAQDAVAKIASSPLPRVTLLQPSGSPLGVGIMVAQSLVEDITIALAASRQFQVVAPYTAAKITGAADKAELYEKHHISYIMDTRYSVSEPNEYIFVQLIHFANEEVIWADRIPLEKGRLAVRRLELASRLSATICDQIGRAETARQYYEKSSDAYYHYLLGQRYLAHLTLPDLRRARREFKSALAVTADFSPALSGVARTLSKEWLLTAQGDIQLLRSAEAFALRAIKCAQDLASGYRELGVAKLLLGAIDESVEALSLAETMSPHYADVLADFADTLVHASRPNQALEKMRLALELNPISPDSYLWTAAGAAYCLQEYQQALRYIGEMQESELATRLAAASWAMLGDAKRARHFVTKARDTYPDFDLDHWISIVPLRDQVQRDHYREGLRKAGF